VAEDQERSMGKAFTFPLKQVTQRVWRINPIDRPSISPKQPLQWHGQNLSKQLLVSLGVSLVTVGCVVVGVSYRFAQTGLEQQVQARAQTITQGLQFAIEGPTEIGYEAMVQRVVENYATLPAVVEIAIVAPNDVIIAHSQQALKTRLYSTTRPELVSAIKAATSSGIENDIETILNGKPVLVQVMPFSSALFNSVEKRGLAIAIIDLQEIRQQAQQTFWTSTLAMAIGTLTILLLMGLILQKVALGPMKRLHQSVTLSKETGAFDIPSPLPTNEIKFLATTFSDVFEQRCRIEIALRESEAREKGNTQQLIQTLQELQQTQAQLIQTEKMSGLGQMVAGIAHEINNPVSFIYGNLKPAQEYVQDLLALVQLYQKVYPQPPAEVQSLQESIDLAFLVEDLQKLLGSMQVGAERIRDIVQSLQNFSRFEQAELKSVDIHEGLESTLHLLQHRFRRQLLHPEIHIGKTYGKLPEVECYPGQLNQVFMNILSNAIDALEQGCQTSANGEFISDRSSLMIRIHTEVLAGRQKDGDRIAIRIWNNGPTIPIRIQSQLFNPFFTTKPVGQGTGLGLAVSYQIVTTQHRGNLVCHSSDEQGTEFVIEIPVCQSGVAA
jgi:two-component system, NtrC family, sensor kinase